MYQVKVKKQNNLSAVLCALLCAGGVGLFGISLNPSVPFPFVAQGFGVLALTAGVTLYSKFFLHAYYYAVRPSGVFDADDREIYDLEVVDEIGKKRTTVCRLGLRDIVRVSARPVRATKKNGQPKIVADGGTVYYYCADVFVQKVIVIYTADGDAVVLTYDAGIYDILSRK